jgi:hypothetical protein
VNLNVHFHSIFLDGVYADPDNAGTPAFFPLPAPDDEEIARVAAASARGIICLLERRGLLSDHGDAATDPLQDEELRLVACVATSLQYRIATGARTGKPCACASPSERSRSLRMVWKKSLSIPRAYGESLRLRLPESGNCR